MITFSRLLAAFPSELNPCRNASGESTYQNQCAIRMSIALLGADERILDNYPDPGNRCAHGHVRWARGLARYLRRQLGQPEIHRNRNAIQGQGIIFYSRDAGKTEHIDLWTTTMCLPNLKLTDNNPQTDGDQRTMSWTTTDANEYWFWPLPY